MNFLKYNLILLISGFPAVLLFSLGLMVTLVPLAFLGNKSTKPSALIAMPLMLLSGAYQVYFWGLWAAYCVGITYRFTYRSEVTHAWLYFVVGFFNSSSLIGWLSYMERQGESYQRQRQISVGTMYYGSVAWLAFIVFSIWPTLITPIYGWAMNVVGLGDVPVFAAASRVAEYTDNNYNFAFQYPSDWKMKKQPPNSEFGEVRMMLQGPRGVSVMVMVGKLGTIISKEKFESAPNAQSIVQQMIDFTIEQLYKKISRDINAKRMTLVEQRIIPSPVAVKFYISTLHISDKGIPVTVAGIHYAPFGKPYGIVFMMVSPVDAKAKAENETLNHVFNSFHLIGEPPPALGKNGGEESAALGNGEGKALGTVERIEGYGGYKFGMTLAEADAVANDDKIVDCDYNGVRKCITRRGEFFGKSGTVVAQIDDKTQRVRQVLVSFEGIESGACDDVARAVRNTLLKSYGLIDVNQNGPRAEWHFPKGGSIGLLKWCDVGMDLVTVSFTPSERQPSDE